MKRIIPVLAFVLCCYSNSWSQSVTDTIKLDLPAAEKIFLDSNLSLLARHYDIDINRAFEKQARLWDNPYLLTDQTLYDGKWFRHGVENGVQYGQVYIQLQQLIRTGGKRNNLIRLSQDNTLSSEAQFNDLMRNLHLLLVNNFNTLFQLQETEKIFTRELLSIQQLVKGMDAQYALGNISLKENMRVKSLLYSLQSNRNSFQLQIIELQGEMRKLLAINDTIFIQPVINEVVNNYTSDISLAALIDSAQVNRPDIKLARTNQFFNQHNLAYQKALAYPDVTTGVEYDRLNSYVPNYWGLTIALPLPVLNRNTGNIQAARLSVDQSAISLREMANRVNQEVSAAYGKWKSLQQLAKEVPPSLNQGYDQLAEKMFESYQQRQVSLVEFIDFFDAYREAKINQLLQHSMLRNSIADINFTTASRIFTLR